MRGGLFIVAIGVCFLAACVSVKSVDPRPGGRVVTKIEPSLPSLTPGDGASIRSWQFVRVIAPAGASECWSVGSPFEGTNPYPKAPVDKDHAALVTVRDGRSGYSFACRTAAGIVRRSIESERVTTTFKTMRNHSYWMTPPMVHIDPADADAAARWDALIRENCPAERMVGPPCAGAQYQHMKARDLSVG